MTKIFFVTDVAIGKNELSINPSLYVARIILLSLSYTTRTLQNRTSLDKIHNLRYYEQNKRNYRLLFTIWDDNEILGN